MLRKLATACAVVLCIGSLCSCVFIVDPPIDDQPDPLFSVSAFPNETYALDAAGSVDVVFTCTGSEMYEIAYGDGEFDAGPGPFSHTYSYGFGDPVDVIYYFSLIEPESGASITSYIFIRRYISN